MFRSKRISELRRFLLSYLLLLVVPLIAIVLSYGVAQNYVRQEERNYHMMMQKQVGMALDEKLSKSNRMVLQIAADATVMAAVAEDQYHGGLSPMTGYYLLQHFTEVVLADDVEYMVYFKNSDTIFGYLLSELLRRENTTGILGGMAFPAGAVPDPFGSL